MNFTEALEAMKNGKRVKRPKMEGYWVWDGDVRSITIYHVLHGKSVCYIDIRELCTIENAVLDMQQDDWMIATKENCLALGGEKTFSFGDAIEHMKNGKKVARLGWNGKKQYIQLATGISYKTADGEIVNCDHDAIGNKAIAFVGTSGVQLGWLASQADMLADDWVFAE